MRLVAPTVVRDRIWLWLVARAPQTTSRFLNGLTPFRNDNKVSGEQLRAATLCAIAQSALYAPPTHSRTQSIQPFNFYHSPAFWSLRILRFMRSRFRALMW